MSRHPELNSYIYQVLLRAKPLMERGVVRRMLVCFFQEAEHVDQAPVEKVAFDIGVDDGGSVDPICLQARSTFRFSAEIEDQLRSALLQIQKSSAHLPTRQNCTFAIHVQAHEEEESREERHDANQEGGSGCSAVRSALRGGNWLLVDSDTQRSPAEPGRRQLVPIKSVRGQGLTLDLSAEMEDCPI
ncbi:unnamed protein product [Scytosiphon promiscuus]